MTVEPNSVHTIHQRMRPLERAVPGSNEVLSLNSSPDLGAPGLAFETWDYESAEPRCP
jgi:hypothetical protein